MSEGVAVGKSVSDGVDFLRLLITHTRVGAYCHTTPRLALLGGTEWVESCE